MESFMHKITKVNLSALLTGCFMKISLQSSEIFMKQPVSKGR